MQHCRELPADVTRVTNPGVHAITTGRDKLVSSVTSQEDAIYPVRRCHKQVWGPRIGDQDLIVKIATCKSAQQLVRIDGLGRYALWPAGM